MAPPDGTSAGNAADASLPASAPSVPGGEKASSSERATEAYLPSGTNPSPEPGPKPDPEAGPYPGPSEGPATVSATPAAAMPGASAPIVEEVGGGERRAGDGPQNDFASATSQGFTGRVLSDGTVRIAWRRDPAAEGYNVYRQGKYYTTVKGSESYIDRKVSKGEYRYEIHSFTRGANKRFKKIASGLTVKVGDVGGGSAASGGGGSDFSSKTPGFTGQVRSDGTVRIAWRRDPAAEGYNVYRQGKYYTTVKGSESYIDRKVSKGEYRYEIHSFTRGANKRFKKIASGLTVKVGDVGGGSAPSAASGGGSDGGSSREFTSATAWDFKARVLDDGTVRLSWRRDPAAGGYNVYRQGKYYTSVATESYLDTKVSRGDYRYEIYSFTRSKPTKFKKIAGDLTVKIRDSGSAPPSLGAAASRSPESKKSKPASSESVSSDTGGGSSGVQQRHFASHTTRGFTGRLLADGTVRLSWSEDPGAGGYNLYRQGKYYTTVLSASHVDKKVFDGDYYYEVRSFTPGTNKRFQTIATGLTVKVRGLGRTDPSARRAKTDLLRGYDLVFADEFNTGALDTTKWNTRLLWGPDLTINSELQYYVDIRNEPDFGFNPFTFEDGKLVINSVRTPTALRAKANNKPYLSGVITSYDAFKFTYGYAEVRARMPYGKGYWPAFWLLNAYYGGDDPELDIVEFIGSDQDTAYHTYHYHDSNGRLRSTKSKATTGIDFTGDFHTFGADWRPGLVVYYVDGVEVHRISDPAISSMQMYLIANTALGGWWPGSPDSTTGFPGRYEIDYIRVYRQTAPYEVPPLSDQPSSVPLAEEVSSPSPGHRPPFELWPEGYPGRR